MSAPDCNGVSDQEIKRLAARILIEEVLANQLIDTEVFLQAWYTDRTYGPRGRVAMKLPIKVGGGRFARLGDVSAVELLAAAYDTAHLEAALATMPGVDPERALAVRTAALTRLAAEVGVDRTLEEALS